MMNCIFCNEGRGELKILTTGGFNAIVKASIERQDELHNSIEMQYLSSYRIHNSCRVKYINKREIAKCAVTRVQSDDIESGSVVHSVDVEDKMEVQSVVSNFCFATCCILCSKSIAKVSKQNVTTMTTQSRHNLLRVSESILGSHPMFVELQTRLCSSQAVHAKYHRKCFTNFTNKHGKTRCHTSSNATCDMMSEEELSKSVVTEMDISDTDNMQHINGTDCNTDNIVLNPIVERMDISESTNDYATSCDISALKANTSVYSQPIEGMNGAAGQHCRSARVQCGVDNHTCIQCASCLRCDLGVGELEIETFNGTLKLRQYSKVRAADNNSDILLCKSCRNYLVTDVSGNKLWSSGWPCVLTTLLSHKKFATFKSNLWKVLPQSYMQWWHLVAACENLDCSDCGTFADRTSQLDHFEKQTKSGNIAHFISAMDEFAFPCVKCPAGCFADIYKCNFLTFNHFLDWKYDVSFFGGDKKLLAGARRDWPCGSNPLEEFSVRASLIIDPVGGLSIMYCNTHDLKRPFVHVPRNPILKDHGLQYADNSAACILTPMVIRDGRMSRWNSSTHVIKAVGGYSGISSSTLSCDVKRTVCDERLAMAQCLSMKHRSDIYHICRERYVHDESLGGLDEFMRIMKHYDTFYQDMVNLRCGASVVGATLIDVEDCYRIHEQMFQRDAKDNVTSNLWKLSLLFPHSAGPCGCRPIVLNKVYNVQEHPLTGAILHLLIHSPSVHTVLLTAAAEEDTSKLLYRILQYAQSCAIRSRNCSKIMNAKDCQTQLRDELSLYDRSLNDPCVEIVRVLASFSASIHSLSLSADMNLDCLVFPSSADVVIIYRDARNAIRNYRNQLPNTIQDYYLETVLSGKNLTETVFFRWNERLSFWHIVNEKQTQTSTMASDCELSVPQWRILVYARRRKLTDIDNAVAMNLNGQRRMWCDIHELFLVKQSVHCDMTCCVIGCSRNARWGCYGRGLACEHSVCFAHGQDMISGNDVVNVEVNMFGRLLPQTRQVITDLNTEPDISDVAYVNCENDLYVESVDDDFDPRVLAPLGIDDFSVEPDALPPKHSRRDLVPIFDVNREVPSHIIWNSHYSVMHRVDRYSNVRSNAIVEHIVASSNSASVSLLYPEGQLFPRIFWCAKSGSIVGAVPSFMLNTTLKNPFGLASLNEHHHVRLYDGDILTSKESAYWHYLFDVKLNTALNHAPSKLVFKRGLEIFEGKDQFASNGQTHLPMDEAEATRRVKELASLLKKGKWTYFVTITVNDQETPGVRMITNAIHQMADGNQQMEKELTENFLPFILRAWERFVFFFFQELLFRNDSIIGKIKNMFYRFEFQGAGAVGNKPHVHAGITLHDERDIVSARQISCNSNLFFSSIYGGDFNSLKAEGIIQDQADYNRWTDIVSCVNIHDCSAAQYRCMKATNAKGETICRYHRQPVMPLTASDGVWFSEVNMPYPEDVYTLLHEMGLAHRVADLNTDLGEQWMVDESIRAGKWHYFARSDEFFLSSIPKLSAICRSSTNVDMCDRKFQVSYLVKYISGKEEHQLVDVTGSKDITQAKTTTESHAHEKITGCKKMVEKKEKEREHLGREICLAEIMWFNLGLPYTYCNADFVHVSTLPLENRAGLINGRWNKSLQISGESVLDIPPVKGRVDANLENWRQFNEDQLVHIDDYRNSPYWCDSTSSFNIRPPELIVFDDLQLYCECFVTTKTQRSSFTQELGDQRWFDGLSRLVLLRSCSVSKAVDFLAAKSDLGDTRAELLLHSVFDHVVNYEVGFNERFVQESHAQQVVSVISLVKPWDRTKFLAHLCLSLGRYTTEVDLFLNSNLRVAFVKAGLFPDGCSITRSHVLSVLRTYILQDLRFHPISARQFGKYIMAAMTTLVDLLEDNVIQDYTPCITNIMLKEQASELVLSKEHLRRASLLTALAEDPAVIGMLPADLTSSTIDHPLQWTPQISQVDGISLETVAEQNAALQCCISAINSFLTPSCRGVKFPLLVGRPGSGKSHVLKLATAYAVSKGLQVELMSFTSERARKLGGSHLHMVFPFGVTSGRISFSHTYASTCLAKLEADPLRAALIKRTDVIIFEEIGLLSAEYFSAIDNVLKVLMGNTSPMGGKLFISCGDSKQLPPIDGRPLWTSLNMCTMMQVFVFQCDVRARGDAILQSLNSDCRRALTAVECKSVAETVVRECRIEPDWSCVPDDACRIVSTKAAEMKVMDEFLMARQTQSFRAIDEVQNGAVWELATNRVTQTLNRNLYEYEVCKLYVGAVVRMTFNCRRDGTTVFSQGQLAVVEELPDGSAQFNSQRLRLRLAPPGERHLGVNVVRDTWQQVSVGPRTTIPTVVGRGLQMGRRTQFPVRYYLASTIHRIQGDNVCLLATELSICKREYRLWQREQFAVLISRVHRCRDVIFVGDIAETKASIEYIMSRSSKWDALIEDYLKELNVASHCSDVRRLVLDRHPFLPMYRELPSTACGYVYMLTSLSCVAPSYIGQCLDLKAELRKINTGYGSEETKNTALHPWGVYAFVYGFDECADDNGSRTRNEFVYEWRVRLYANANPDEVFQLCCDVANDWAKGTSRLGYVGQLTVVKCGQLLASSGLVE